MKRAAQKKPSATSAAAPAMIPPIVDFTARSILCLMPAIKGSNTAPCLQHYRFAHVLVGEPVSTSPEHALAAPRRAEQEAQADGERDRRQRVLLDRLLQRLAEMLADVAQ